MKYLDNTNNIAVLHRVKAIVRDCNRRFRMGDESVSPLHDAIESRLQIMVDDDIWNRAILCLELYMAQREDLKKSVARQIADSTPVHKSKQVEI